VVLQFIKGYWLELSTGLIVVGLLIFSIWFFSGVSSNLQAMETRIEELQSQITFNQQKHDAEVAYILEIIKALHPTQ
jgi:hypothetical protein